MSDELLPNLIWLTHLGSTLCLVGLIGMVQWVHYPLFAQVGEAFFVDYECQHTARIRWLVGPAMLAEAASAACLFVISPPGLIIELHLLGCALICIVWLSTWLVQIPCHEKLSRGFDVATHRRLVKTNWLRTACWVLRGALVLSQTFFLLTSTPSNH